LVLHARWYFKGLSISNLKVIAGDEGFYSWQFENVVSGEMF
jgi:hypothetical protein